MKKVNLKRKEGGPKELLEGEVEKIERKEDKIFYQVKLHLEQVFDNPPQEYLKREFEVPKSAEFVEYDHKKEKALKINPDEIETGDWLLLYLEESGKEIVEQESLKVIKVMRDTKSFDFDDEEDDKDKKEK